MEYTSLLVYDVPELSPDGTCSASRGQYEKFSLAEELFNCNPEEAAQKFPKSVERLVTLKKAVQECAEKHSIEWLGLYFRKKQGDRYEKCYHCLSSSDYLLKVAYTGSPSRAVFPLTSHFATLSNNSFCAMNGSRSIIQDTYTHSGPYYVCDANVKSEYCAALFGSGCNDFNHPPEAIDQDKVNHVTGLLDAEAWRTNTFTEEVIAALEELGSFAGKLFKEGVVID